MFTFVYGKIFVIFDLELYIPDWLILLLLLITVIFDAFLISWVLSLL